MRGVNHLSCQKDLQVAVTVAAGDDLSHGSLAAIDHQEVKLLRAHLDPGTWVGHKFAWAILDLGAVASNLQLIHADVAARDHDMDLLPQ